MPAKPKKDPTKSVAWLALSKETQEKLILTYTQMNEGKDRKDAGILFEWMVHNSLGVRAPFPVIKDFCGFRHCCGGKIFDTIDKYVRKYETIANAVDFEYNKRKSPKDIVKEK